MPAALRVDLRAVGAAVAVLRRGGLVAFPTETVYGLGADADQPLAVAAIFRAKGRPHTHPLIVHVAHADAVPAWARLVPDEARTLMRRFWPGPLTLILPRSARAGDAVTGGQDSVGLRCPSDPWAQALLQGLCTAAGDPAAAIAAPSANRYGRISPTSAEHVRRDLGEKPAGLVDFILDGGSAALGIESTIVDFAAGAVRILRPGSIDREQLAQALGAAVETAADEAQAPRASGRVAGHYAPGKPMELVPADELTARVAALSALPLGVFAPAQALGALARAPNLVIGRSAPLEAPQYAHVLYDELRRLDASAAARLLVAVPPAGERWDAIHDRLRRAAAGSRGELGEAD